ncbi:MAG: hypothetical protein ACSHWW_08920 [Nonlabens sp.]|uniref:hypothetical protein n=1 Tax=Nonlabens sp. TaxID=1888209 RepID=UPI003EF4C486
MNPTRKGQIAKFHTPFEDEDPEQLYVILEYIEDDLKSRVKILALETGLSFPPVSVVWAKDLIVDEIRSFELGCYLKNGIYNRA